jgi:hypothetical protein
MLSTYRLRLLKLRGPWIGDGIDGDKVIFLPGGVVQWPSHLPEEHKIRVRIPPGCKGFQGKQQCCVC